MAAMTSRFNIRCVIQYFSDQWLQLKTVRMYVHIFGERRFSEQVRIGCSLQLSENSRDAHGVDEILKHFPFTIHGVSISCETKDFDTLAFIVIIAQLVRLKVSDMQSVNEQVCFIPIAYCLLWWNLANKFARVTSVHCTRLQGASCKAVNMYLYYCIQIQSVRIQSELSINPVFVH